MTWAPGIEEKANVDDPVNYVALITPLESWYDFMSEQVSIHFTRHVNI